MLEFSIDQSVLKTELGYISGVIERKSTIPVLANIAIESIDDATLRLIGTDLDHTIVATVPAKISRTGSLCVNAAKLIDIVKNLEPGPIAFAADDKDYMNLKAGKAKFRIAGINREQYPTYPQPKSMPFEIDPEVINYMFTHVAFAISNEVSRFTLSGAKFVVADGVVRAVSTDGHRLAFIEKKVDVKTPETVDMLVPKKAMQQLTRLITAGGPVLKFGQDPQHIFFESGTRMLCARRLTGNFPNYELVMPKDNDKAVIFDHAPIKAAVRRVSMMVDQRNRSLRFTVRPGEVEVAAQSAEEGEGKDFVPANYEGEETVLGFNNQYLLEFFNIVATGTEVEPAEGEEKETNLKLRFEFKDQHQAIQIRIEGETGYDYRYVLMPLRI